MMHASNQHAPSLATGPKASAVTIPALVLAASERSPSGIALRADAGSVTYRELVERSRTVAVNMRGHGIQPGAVIPVLARRTLDLPSVLLGILRAGAAYTLLDPRWPAERIANLIGALEAPMCIVDAHRDDHLPSSSPISTTFTELFTPELGTDQDDSVHYQKTGNSADSTAIVFWTSGSTGEPKAVATPHAAVSRLVTPPGCIPFSDPSTMIAAAAVPWDAFALELWGMLMTGGTAIMHGDDILLPHTIRHYIEGFGATHLFLTSSLFDVIAAAQPSCFNGLRVLTVGGEKLNPISCARVCEAVPDLALFNGYGPVESCVFATSHRVEPGSLLNATEVPIGRPVPGTQVLVCDGDSIVPLGTTGEILIAGSGLAQGYLDQPELTAEAFVSIATSSGRLHCYRTGDLGWMDQDGTMHCLGRKDDQFKIAGHRIEPHEIEQVAHDCGVKRSLALKASSASNPFIVLFASEAGIESKEALQDAFTRRLPAYMRPTAIHLVESFPMTSNQKIDKKALLAAHGYQA